MREVGLLLGMTVAVLVLTSVAGLRSRAVAAVRGGEIIAPSSAVKEACSGAVPVGFTVAVTPRYSTSILSPDAHSDLYVMCPDGAVRHVGHGFRPED